MNELNILYRKLLSAEKIVFDPEVGLKNKANAGYAAKKLRAQIEAIEDRSCSANYLSINSWRP